MKKQLIIFFQLLPVIVSFLLIGAHYLRSGNHVMVALSLVLPAGLFIRHPLPARLVQLALFLSAVEWGRTAFILVSVRSEAGLDWNRLVIILGTVVFFTFASIFLFFLKPLKDRYRLGTNQA